MPEATMLFLLPGSFRTTPTGFIDTDAGARWTYTFPGHSITVIRFKTMI
jgi:hypothetical protein